VIRINLLPQKKRAERREASQAWLVVLMALFVAEVIALFVFHGYKGEELAEQRRKNAELTAQIDQAKRAVANHDEVKKALEGLRAREDAIAKLKSARTGPTAMMLELARLLTPGRGPHVEPQELERLRRESPAEVYNAGWDARRLWLTSFIEKQREVILEGVARDGEDVSELARRMSLSSYFDEVKFLPAKKTKNKESGLELVQFELQAKVRY
jgi:type IV pilus assembly protein PilN